MKRPFFEIIVVSYNAGERLTKTVQSIAKQTFKDYRVFIKDGMSTDGSVKKLKETFDVADAGDEDAQITFMESCDNGIYHAMNIATAFLSERAGELRAGEDPSYIFFLNCGDYFRDENVLKNVHRFIAGRNKKEGTTVPAVYYGDIFESSTGTKVCQNPKIDDYACYRNLPTHQACFYDERLVYRNPFDLSYKVRADYDQFLKCIYLEKADTVYMPLIVANYEGGGFSDQNKRISEDERKRIIVNYLPKSKIRKYDFLRIVTLSGLRTALASNRVTAGLYNAVKNAVYSAKNKRNKKR